MTDLEQHDSLDKFNQFVADVLTPWTQIEGSEVGEAQVVVLDAGRTANSIDSYLGYQILDALDKHIREMITSDWFTEMLGEEEPPYDYYTQGMTNARAKFEEIKHKHIAKCKQFGGLYGGERAEQMIKEYEAI